MSPEKRFRAALVEAWNSSPAEMSDPSTARLRDMLTILLEDRGLVADGRLTEAGRFLAAEILRSRVRLQTAVDRIAGQS